VYSRGRATGVAMTGSGAGNFVYALALQAVINSYDDGHCSDEASVQGDDGVKCEGWRWALRYEAALSFGLCAIASLMVARPVNAAPTVHAMRRLTMSTTAAKLLDTGPVGGPVRVSTMALVGTPCSRAMAIYWFFAGFGYLNVFAHFAAHAEDSGLSKWDAALLLSFMGLASVCGRVLLGLAADRFNRIHVLAFTCFMLALTAAVWPAATSFDGLVVIALLYVDSVRLVFLSSRSWPGTYEISM
jgi:cyanate permease